MRSFNQAVAGAKRDARRVSALRKLVRIQQTPCGSAVLNWHGRTPQLARPAQQPGLLRRESQIQAKAEALTWKGGAAKGGEERLKRWAWSAGIRRLRNVIKRPSVLVHQVVLRWQLRCSQESGEAIVLQVSPVLRCDVPLSVNSSLPRRN